MNRHTQRVGVLRHRLLQGSYGQAGQIAAVGVVGDVPVWEDVAAKQASRLGLALGFLVKLVHAGSFNPDYNGSGQPAPNPYGVKIAI